MNPKKHKPEPLNFTTKALAHFKHMVSMQGKENKVKLGVKRWAVMAILIFLNLQAEPINPITK